MEISVKSVTHQLLLQGKIKIGNLHNVLNYHTKADVQLYMRHSITI